MSTNLYRINNWAVSTFYSKNDVVKVDNRYFYCLADHTSGAHFATDSSYWSGYKLDSKGVSRPFFHWIVSYNTEVVVAPRVKKIQFGDGYEQRSEDGIYNDLLELDVVFDLRSDRESLAINHFLRTRKAVEAFLCIPSPPYAEEKLFTCEQWSNSHAFFNNHTIKARFIEKVN